MVEGSKVDRAAHANDPHDGYGVFSFDKAVAVALDYAADGNTIVLVTADHGNSGMSIGRPADKGWCARLTLDEPDYAPDTLSLQFGRAGT